MEKTLEKRIGKVKFTALMENRKRMGAVELVNWWTAFRARAKRAGTFERLDQATKKLIGKWEAQPYREIGS